MIRYFSYFNPFNVKYESFGVYRNIWKIISLHDGFYIRYWWDNGKWSQWDSKHIWIENINFQYSHIEFDSERDALNWLETYY